jgi:Iron/zinc purple acid phosphatase-like protein C
VKLQVWWGAGTGEAAGVAGWQLGGGSPEVAPGQIWAHVSAQPCLVGSRPCRAGQVPHPLPPPTSCLQFPDYQPQRCFSYQPQYAQHAHYCPSSQPNWEAFRATGFGAGALTLINATHARWAQVPGGLHFWGGCRMEPGPRLRARPAALRRAQHMHRALDNVVCLGPAMRGLPRGGLARSHASVVTPPSSLIGGSGTATWEACWTRLTSSAAMVTAPATAAPTPTTRAPTTAALVVAPALAAAPIVVDRRLWHRLAEMVCRLRKFEHRVWGWGQLL